MYSPEKDCLYYVEETIPFLSSGAEEISFIHSPLVLGEGPILFPFMNFLPDNSIILANNDFFGKSDILCVVGRARRVACFALWWF